MLLDVPCTGLGVLRRNPDADRVGESLRDTLMDLAAYALISIRLLEGEG